ncbi:MAG: tetratricopeptide (TPR) repeat protein, partial [Myxococcota bacterium]
RGQADRAVSLCRRGLTLVGPDAAVEALQLLDLLARTWIETSEFDEAERCLADQLRYAAIIEDDARVGRAHTVLAEVLRDRGRFEQSSAHLDAALSLFARLDDPAGRADALEAQGLLFARQGHRGALSLAIDVVREALTLRSGQPLARARTLAVMANLLYSTGQIEEAIEQHREALNIRESAGDRRGQMLSLNGLGVARYDNGQHDDAIALWQQALGIADQLGDRAQRVMLLMNLGEARLATGHLQDAQPAIQEAVDTAKALGLQRLHGLALALLSSLELAGGAEARALELADAAVDLAHSIDSQEVLGQALLARARSLSNALFIADQEGDDRMDRASECYQKAITLLEEMGERPTLVRALDAYGSFLLERGVMDKGRKAIERAEELRGEMRSPEQQERVFHEARTIRRTYPTGPVAAADIELMLDLVDRRRK